MSWDSGALINGPQSAQPGGWSTGVRPAAPIATWIIGFLVFQIACQIGLLVLGSTPARLPLRIGAFGGSLLMLAMFQRRFPPHPAYYIAYWILAILGFGMFHPDRNSLLASFSHIGMYVAILAPLAWVAAAEIDRTVFRKVVLILWAFYSLSAVMGVLQTRFPFLQPELSQVYLARGEQVVEANLITLASGQQVFRPMGLTDVPGGAANGGFYAIILGLGLLLTERQTKFKVFAVLGMGAGLFCIYLSQVRSILVMSGICLLAFGFVLAWRRDWTRLTRIGAVVGIVIAVSTAAAFTIGGEMTINRLRTLIEHDPATVYYANRGHFLHRTIAELAPQYPLGAGIARWGMTTYYFGSSKGSLWAEIQWTAWLYDGGIPLIIAYSIAIAVTLLVAWRIGTAHSQDPLCLWGAVVFAYNVGALAVTFNYPLFMSQTGMEFWLLNATLFAAWQWHQWQARAQLAHAHAPSHPEVPR